MNFLNANGSKVNFLLIQEVQTAEAEMEEVHDNEGISDDQTNSPEVEATSPKDTCTEHAPNKDQETDPPVNPESVVSPNETHKSEEELDASQKSEECQEQEDQELRHDDDDGRPDLHDPGVSPESQVRRASESRSKP